MKASIAFVEERFEKFNRLMFGGRLPMPRIMMSEASSYLGICKSRIERLEGGGVRHYDFQLRFNMTYDLPEEVLEDTIIHEMIHYFIMLHGLQDTSPHGQIFKSIMKSMNAAYGRNLSISHRVTGEQKKSAKASKPTWHVIAVMTFHSGITGIKVLPRVVPKIIDFYNRIKGIREIKEVRLFLHDNPFFNNYPTSVAMRYHEMKADELEKELVGSHRLVIKGNKLIQC